MAPATLILADRYQVDLGRVLGVGRTGTVFLGLDLETQRALAVKRLHRDLAGGSPALPSLLPPLPHRHLVRTVDVVVAEGETWLVCEHFDGVPLTSIETPLAPNAVIALGLALCDALASLHAQGLVHGDVRPGNVLVGRQGAVLFDLGLAEWAGTAVVGRPGQTAPELASGATPQPPADLYGLGVVLFRGLAGELPYSGPTPWAVVGAQSRLPPPQPPGPLGLARLVQQLLHPDPWRRPLRASDVRSALVRLSARPERAARIGGRVPPIRPRRAWAVHGIDPATGAPVLVESDLSRRRARRLVRHLAEQGWQVRATRVALSGRDVLWVALLTLIAGCVLPIVGAPLGLWLGLRWRSRGVVPSLPLALPAPSTKLPPRSLSWGTEYAVAAGLLLIVAAILVRLFPPLALVPLGLAAWIAWTAARARPESDEVKAWRGRIQLLLSESRHAIADSALPLDEALLLQGALDGAEERIRAGEWTGDRALEEVSRLHEQALRGRLPAGDEGASLDPLRRSAVALANPADSRP